MRGGACPGRSQPHDTVQPQAAGESFGFVMKRTVMVCRSVVRHTVSQRLIQTAALSRDSSERSNQRKLQRSVIDSHVSVHVNSSMSLVVPLSAFSRQFLYVLAGLRRSRGIN